MSQRGNMTSRRMSRPGCEGLESRALLSVSAAKGHAAAVVHALSHGHEDFESRESPLLKNLPSKPQKFGSTIPASGDLNPYGVAFVPSNFVKGGPLKNGDILVSNFNNSGNLQGTGTSIVRVTPAGKTTLFAQTAAGTGLTTALGVLSNRFILVGSLPSTDGTAATAQAGSLLLLDRFGNTLSSFSDPTLLNGPWDLTVVNHGTRAASIYVANVLSGTITRLDVNVPAHGSNVTIAGATQIASGYTHMPDPAAFELGPTGLAYDGKHDTLYVASTADNEIFAVKNAGKTKADGGTGSVVYADQTHLHGPLGLAFAPNGDLITANGDAVNPDNNQPSELVEFTPKGKFVGQLQVNTNAGAAFGLAVASKEEGARLAAVDDVLSQLNIYTVGEF
jgi:hypothetical protein